eukprot:1278506-Rhodomonas_salina.2
MAPKQQKQVSPTENAHTPARAGEKSGGVADFKKQDGHGREEDASRATRQHAGGSRGHLAFKTGRRRKGGAARGFSPAKAECLCPIPS